MINLATVILFSTYGRNLGNFFFNTCLFFANYLNFVCFILKKISHIFKINTYKDLNGLHNIKQANLNGLIKENKSMHLLNISCINDLDVLNSSILETETEINEHLSTEVEDFDEDEYNFEFIDLVQQNSFEE
ncbi:conserved Plasmodium protein, unknown function [Plasmodium gallinaceum]|uniref:Uncharacterized protein n=1 Tax=Plasmodium gallinaceum TaxID=5849 RepID=A0A1J1GM82_PLAGA|nr:conserved Plasmodium protein, unknown function [Plasmodium gallinaceum]CRG93534.1 conserved Plasmodium protein, unknown function [Plasmodium gallinaceum]